MIRPSLAFASLAVGFLIGLLASIYIRFDNLTHALMAGI